MLLLHLLASHLFLSRTESQSLDHMGVTEKDDHYGSFD